MSFREKSAWIMSIALLVTGALYLRTLTGLSVDNDLLTLPILPFIIGYTIILTVIAVIGHIVIAIQSPRDANNALDEREQKIIERSGHWSGYAFAAGVFLSLGFYLLHYNGNLLFYTVFASIIVSQLIEYLIQIVLFRSVLR